MAGREPVRVTQASLLEVSHVHKSFTGTDRRKVAALSDVTFGVRSGSLSVILGPSGCGKSTILRLVAGLDAPDSGVMRLDGEVISGPSQSRGMVFQAYTSFDWLTVQQNVEYGMRLNGVARAERRERARAAIEMVGLADFSTSRPSELSGGMKQRVAIARTLANRPRLLLLDEPFGALDAQTRWHMQEAMAEIVARTNTTVVMVTHDIEEALFLADAVIFISRRPGTVLREFDVAFKKGARVRTKEELFSLAGYAEYERDVMRLMREQVR